MMNDRSHSETRTALGRANTFIKEIAIPTPGYLSEYQDNNPDIWLSMWISPNI